ncbi:MAG: zinc ribbon domain-containing protein [Oscillospiraceae bacterium]
MLICGDCGTPYKRVTWSKRGKTKTVWRCINRLDHGTKYCKDSPTIEESRLHDAIVKALNTMMPEREYMMDTLQRNMQIVLSDNPNEINPFSIENAIKEREKAIIDLVAV